jgi:hypothetical protein
MAKILKGSFNNSVDQTVRVGENGSEDKTDGFEDRKWRKNMIDTFLHVDDKGSFKPVADLSALRAIDTTDAENWPDAWTIFVKTESSIYALDRASTAAEEGTKIIAPTTGVGRWIKSAGDTSAIGHFDY